MAWKKTITIRLPDPGQTMMSYDLSWLDDPLRKQQPPEGSIDVGSLPRARRVKRRFGAVLSFMDPDIKPGQMLRFHRKPAPAHLILACKDLDGEGDIPPSSPELAAFIPQRDQVARIIAFGRETWPASLMSHCHAGVGRSSAGALAILADRLGHGQEELALDALLVICPWAVPNLAIIRHADGLLERNGRLEGLVREWDATRPWNQWRREQNRLSIVTQAAGGTIPARHRMMRPPIPGIDGPLPERRFLTSEGAGMTGPVLDDEDGPEPI